MWAEGPAAEVYMRRTDVRVERREVEALSSLDRLKSFFERLGYDTSRRAAQPLENFGLAVRAVSRSL